MSDVFEHQRKEATPTRGRAEADAARPAPRAASALRLQRAAGNRAVAGLLGPVAKPPPGTIQTLRTADQWVTDTTTVSGVFKKTADKRPKDLLKIDAGLRDYEKARGKNDLDAAMTALNHVSTLLAGWRLTAEPKIHHSFSKEERAAAEAHGAKKVKNWQQVADLQKEIDTEVVQVQKELNDRDTAREKAKVETRAQERLDPLIPKDLKAKKDVGEKALTLFRIFMEQFRGSAKYTTTSLKGVSIWDRTGTTACATNCYGLAEFLRRGGLTANVVELTQRYFVTFPLGDSFIDPSAPGNIAFPGKTLPETRRYFFTNHWIVAVTGGPFLDPTSGVVTDAAGKDVVDPDHTGFAMKDGDYTNGREKVAVTGKDDRGGSTYALSPA